MKRVGTFSLLVMVLSLAHAAPCQTAETPWIPIENNPPASVTGSGTTNYLPLWTGSTALGNSKVYETGGNAGIGNTAPAWALDVTGQVNLSVDYRIAGNLELSMPGGSSSGNIALGDSLFNNTTGIFNTAIDGGGALVLNTTESYNTAAGYAVLDFHAPGSFNTAIGYAAFDSGAGSYDTGVGEGVAGFSELSGNSNTLIGTGAAENAGNANQNTAFGEAALLRITSGSNNIGLGEGGADVYTTESNNITIGNGGTAGDSGVTRIGTSGTQTSFFMAGVRGVTINVDSVAVLIDSNGQLGTFNSSRRFKTDIQDMGNASRNLTQLRPVTFRYQKPFAGGSQPLQYGLIAEEVAEVYPDLVAHSSAGQVQAVKYQALGPMLLNEVQHDEADIRDLQEQLNQMEAALASVSDALESQ